MKATRDFYERLPGMKLYKKGDEYVSENKERVAFLLQNSYLEESKKVTKKKSGD